ncbi:MAG: 4a-hydroxytetrahydrobiopterin dehydratase [Proteobacteria bacterium]|nr:4a-hydroxytetrahydrobiopterin dehydratase [Pseudomonadota bacterium]
MPDLSQKHCLPCEGGVKPLGEEKVKQLMQLLEHWGVSANHKEIFRDFHFKDYYHTMAFVNAVAWMAHHENHHPDLEIGYNHCKVRYTTHAIDGLSENDFICAVKVDKVLKGL